MIRLEDKAKRPSLFAIRQWLALLFEPGLYLATSLEDVRQSRNGGLSWQKFPTSELGRSCRVLLHSVTLRPFMDQVMSYVLEDTYGSTRMVMLAEEALPDLADSGAAEQIRERKTVNLHCILLEFYLERPSLFIVVDLSSTPSLPQTEPASLLYEATQLARGHEVDSELAWSADRP